jgi:hypothetical protein
MIRDYNSTIGCLPNSQTVVPAYPTQERFGKYYDRLNKNNQANELVSPYSYNSFKNSNKIETSSKLGEERAFGVSSGGRTNPIVFRKGKPEGVTNVFKSQITFS